jgi:integrase/recombinase XerC
VKFSDAIDRFEDDMRSQGRLNSESSVRGYRASLAWHADDVSNRDPRYTAREDVKRTLSRWRNPNSQRIRRAHLISFYEWLMQEGYRKDNPARQTRPPRARKPEVYRLTRDEAARLLAVAHGVREQRAIFLGICAGLRNAELRGLQGRHFQRPGVVHVSADIAKGGTGRWVPATLELVPVLEEIRSNVAPDEYVLPAQRWRNPGDNSEKRDYRKRPSSSQALRTLVGGVAIRAGIAAHIHPHLMRHAYADHIARHAGTRVAQFLLGHSALGTTETYLGAPTLDELSAAVSGFAFGVEPERTFYPRVAEAAKADKAPTRIELV